MAERSNTRRVPYWALPMAYGTSVLKLPQQPVPQVAITCLSASTVPLPSRTWTRNVASNTFARPATWTGLPAAAPQAGRSTKIAGRMPMAW